MTELQTSANLLKPKAKEAANTTVGFFDLESFELTQRMATLLSKSSLVPAHFRYATEKYNSKINEKELVHNPEAIPNCAIALNMASRLKADPIMVMQNLYIIEGRPSWSSQWIIACINKSGRFTPLQFKIEDLGDKDIEYQEVAWVNRQKQTTTKKTTIRNLQCIAFAKDIATDEIVESAPVSMELAVKEGWYGKNGSKWQTMPEMMLRYRAASFFGRIYAPDLLMGFTTVEESEDLAYIETNEQGEVTENTAKVKRSRMKNVEAETVKTVPNETPPPAEKPKQSTVTVDQQTIDTETGEVIHSNDESYPVNPDDEDEADLFDGV